MVDIEGKVVGGEEGRVNGNLKRGGMEIDGDGVKVLNGGKRRGFGICDEGEEV